VSHAKPGQSRAIARDSTGFRVTQRTGRVSQRTGRVNTHRVSRNSTNGGARTPTGQAYDRRSSSAASQPATMVSSCHRTPYSEPTTRIRPRGVHVILNLHERWLLAIVGVRRHERRQLFRALTSAGLNDGEVDLLAETGGFTLAKRSVTRDLEQLFDELLRPYGPSLHGVAYGNRRYRKVVILAAALHRAGVDAKRFHTGWEAGERTINGFKRR